MTTSRMRKHLFLGVFNPLDMLTPFSSMYRCWEFTGGGKVEFNEYYIFGIRVARIRL
jgi:hypothetical protein